MMNLGKKLGFAALLAFGAVTSANAGLVALDDFDYATPINISDPGTSFAQRNDINQFNGDVQYTITQTAGSLGTAGAKSFNVLDGDLKWNNESGIQSILEILYGEFNESPGAAPLDLTGGGSQDAFYFDVVQSDFGFAIDVVVGDIFGGFSIWSNISQQISTLTRQTAEFNSFSALGLFAAADFTNTAFVQVTLSSNGVDSVDLHLQEFGTIPEPTTLAIFALGLIGFAASRKRQVK